MTDILHRGQFGVESVDGRQIVKIGDGTTAWKDLPPLPPAAVDYYNAVMQEHRVRHQLISLVPVWIPVSERLPDRGIRVLIWCDDEDTDAWDYGIGSYSRTVSGNVWFDTEDGGEMPSHWMPLPEAPEADAMLRERANNPETPDSSDTTTLTDAEREAIELAVHCWTQFLDVEPACEAAGETLRRLLDRTQSQHTTPDKCSVQGEGTELDRHPRPEPYMTPAHAGFDGSVGCGSGSMKLTLRRCLADNPKRYSDLRNKELAVWKNHDKSVSKLLYRNADGEVFDLQFVPMEEPK